MFMRPDILSASLVDRYNLILNTRMIGVPVVNAKLRVEVVGLLTWNDAYVGVLITPWFMNLMLISSEGDRWSDLNVGSMQVHDFPSGRYEFVVGHDEVIGYYQSFPLFSPMFDFDHHDDALLVAQETMNVIMDGKHRDPAGSRNEAETNVIVKETTSASGFGERLQKPMSRRHMLRGGFLRGDEE